MESTSPPLVRFPFRNIPPSHERRYGRLPLDNPDRIARRDAKLLHREKCMAAESTRGRLKCPCTECNGRHTRSVRRVESHLHSNGRHPDRRVWTSPHDADSSDDEWRSSLEEANVARRSSFLADALGNIIAAEAERTDSVNIAVDEVQPPEADVPAGIDVQRLVSDVFEDLDAFHDNMEDIEDHVYTDSEVEEDENDVEMGHETSEEQRMHTEQGWAFGTPEQQRRASDPLFPGSNCSKLAYVIMFMNICGNHGVPNVFVSELLCFLKKTVLPAGNVAPASHYEATKVMTSLGLNYTSIHACPSGHVLFRGDLESSLTCPECGANRYRNVGRSTVPAKVLRYFPIIPRLQRMFRSSAISELMSWTSENQSIDGLQRHIGDSDHWKQINTRWPEFAAEKRNIRFGLSTDGLNPFGDKNNVYSCWPVTLLNYNLPPWMVTKKFFVLLVMIIPGPESALARNIDVFFAPAIDELKLLQPGHGVMTHDVLGSVERPTPFKLCAMLILSIEDYPAHGMMCGQVTKGYLGCTTCGPNVTSEYSRALKSVKYQGSRRFLDTNHPYRTSASQIVHWGNKVELRGPPIRVTKEDIVEWGARKARYDADGGIADGPQDPAKRSGVKRQTALDLELEYWREFQPSKHNIDVMHVEKNICESLLKFLCGDKDTGAVRIDLEHKNLRPYLWLRPHDSNGDVFLKFQAPYVCTVTEWSTFLSRLASVRVPTGYAGAFKKHVRNKKLGSLTSHDYHVLMQQILPLCLRGLLQKPVRSAIMRLSNVFRRICVKVWDPASFDDLRKDVACLLCDFEIYFPPAFFDVMTHLLIHVVEELGQYGPVATRWMYPLERYGKCLKSHVRTRCRPEASMALGYIKDETLGYLTEYMAGFQHIKTRVWQSEEDEGAAAEVPQGKGRKQRLSVHVRDKAHEYVLLNTKVMEPWVINYENAKRAHVQARGGEHFLSLAEWIRDAIRIHAVENVDVDEDLVSLSNPPQCVILSYKKLTAFGNHYRVVDENTAHTISYDSGLISVFEQQSTTQGRAWLKFGYVGELTSIWKLNYGSTSTPIILMKGSWVRPDWTGARPTMKRDGDGFLLANFRQRMPEWNEPFVFPSQVEQAFFLDVEESPGWRIVCQNQARSRRIEGSGMEFLLDANEAFRRPQREAAPITEDSTEFVPLTRVDTWLGEVEVAEV